MKDANLMSVMRFLQLSHTCLPETMSSEFRGIRQASEEGYPIIVVTRGAYGRLLDPKEGPSRNDARDKVWELVRKAREDNARMNITCVDVPAHATTEEIARCAEPPLDKYRELAYYDGVWYAPTAVDAGAHLKWLNSNPRKPLVHAGVRNILDTENAKKRDSKFPFDRKNFAWWTPDTSGYYMVSWKPVHTDAEHAPAPVDPERLAFDATKPLGEPEPVGVVEAAAESRMANATLIQDAVSCEWERLGSEMPKLLGTAKATALLHLIDMHVHEQAQHGRSCTKAAAGSAISHLRKLFQDGEDEAGELEALRALAKVSLASVDPTKGRAAVADLRQLCKTGGDSQGEVDAERLLVESLIGKGKLDEAVEAAQKLRTAFGSKADAVGSAAAAGLLVDALLAKKDHDAALQVANEAHADVKNKGSPEAEATTLKAQARVHGAMGHHPATLDSLREACTLYRNAGKKAQQAEALQEMVQMLLGQKDYESCHQVVDSMLSLGQQDPGIHGQALLMYAKVNLMAGSSLESVEEAATQAARECEQAGDFKATATAKILKAQALFAAGQLKEALAAAKDAESLLRREHVVSAPLAEVHLACARVSLGLDHQHSALWSAKQALVAASHSKDTATAEAASGIITQLQGEGGKDVNIGAPVPSVPPRSAASLQIV